MKNFVIERYSHIYLSVEWNEKFSICHQVVIDKGTAKKGLKSKMFLLWY